MFMTDNICFQPLHCVYDLSILHAYNISNLTMRTGIDFKSTHVNPAQSQDQTAAIASSSN